MNEPRPGQMTVADLRNVLDGVPDETVVVLILPQGGVGDPRFASIRNVKVEYRGPILAVLPYEGDLAQPHPQRRI